MYIRKVKRSLCFTDFLFCTILRDRLERKREKERKIKRKEKNCTEEDAGTVCKYRNVSFLVSTFRLPASSRPDGLSLSSCIPVTIIIRWGCQKGKKRGKGGWRRGRAKSWGWDRKRKATKKGGYDFMAPEASASRWFYQDFSFVYHEVIYERLIYYFSW